MGQVLGVIACITIGACALAVICGIVYGVYNIGKWCYGWIKCKLFRY
jgi:hypothetical protein